MLLSQAYPVAPQRRCRAKTKTKSVLSRTAPACRALPPACGLRSSPSTVPLFLFPLRGPGEEQKTAGYGGTGVKKC
jgi:hypothetical protein